MLNKLIPIFIFLSLSAFAQKDPIADLMRRTPNLEAAVTRVECLPGMPEINLEARGGVFEGVPQDHQDGLNTCYANVARNLMLSASRRQDNPSFLDIAIQFKKAFPQEYSISPLDFGRTCEAIQSVQNAGYCPQQNSPFEVGGDNLLIQGKERAQLQARSLQALSTFLSENEVLKNDRSPSMNTMMRRMGPIIERLKANSNLQIPLPVVRHQIPSEQRLIELHSAQSGTRDLKTFKSIYANAYKNFYPHYVQAVLQRKNPDQIFEIYQRMMGPTLTALNLNSSLGAIKNTWVTASYEDFNLASPTLLRDSIDFLRFATGKTSGTDADFLEDCVNVDLGVLNFLRDLQPLVAAMNNSNISTNSLVNANGEMKPASEIIQALIAPTCLNPANRVRPAQNINCSNNESFLSSLRNSGKSAAEQRTDFRSRIAHNLNQGLALGRSYPLGTSSHIDTVVGLRYDSLRNTCAYLIRDSIYGHSRWEPEERVFANIETLVEVSRQP